MTLEVTHSTVATLPDEPGAEINKTEWNAPHAITGMSGGIGEPNDANGSNGDIYFREDGGALTTIYQKRAGSWVGIL